MCLLHKTFLFQMLLFFHKRTWQDRMGTHYLNRFCSFLIWEPMPQHKVCQPCLISSTRITSCPSTSPMTCMVYFLTFTLDLSQILKFCIKVFGIISGSFDTPTSGHENKGIFVHNRLKERLEDRLERKWSTGILKNLVPGQHADPGSWPVGSNCL